MISYKWALKVLGNLCVGVALLSIVELVFTSLLGPAASTVWWMLLGILSGLLGLVMLHAAEEES